MINWSEHKEYLLNLNEQGLKKRKIAEILANKLNVPYNETFRKRVSSKLKSYLIESGTQMCTYNEEDFNNVNETKTNDYSSDGKNLGYSAINPETKQMLSIEEYCDLYGLDFTKVKSYKLITHSGIPFYNVVFYENGIDFISEDRLESIIKKQIKPLVFDDIDLFVNSYANEDNVIRAIMTDVHIGMEVNQNGFGLYGGKWDYDELMSRAKDFVKFVMEKTLESNSTTLIIDTLGDMLDGWDGLTTRGGHQLPQNMDNEKAFESALDFMSYIIDTLATSNMYEKIIVNNVCNDNHSGSFGYVFNHAMKRIVEIKYEGLIEYNNYRKFIDHYFIGKHCFIISHGKDAKTLKFGFKPKIDSVAIEKIDNYINVNKIRNKSEFIEFSKGDSHQMLFDYSSSDNFDYMNYPAFSPSSEWVQSNFKIGKSGFVVQTFNKNKKEKNVSYKLYDWNE